MDGTSVGKKVSKKREADGAAVALTGRRPSRSPPVQLKDWQHYVKALEISKMSCWVIRFAVELFSGSGRFSRAWCRRINIPIIEFDIRHGDK